MNIYLVSDTHFNHGHIATYCDRPENFTEIIISRWRQTVRPEDYVIHLGDVFIGKPEGWDAIWPQLPGKKTLILGNHDWKRSESWWLTHGFDSVCHSMIFRRCWLTHKPADRLPPGCILNIHGHLHNIWHGFHKDAKPGSPEQSASFYKKLKYPWQRLFAIEYTDYRPVNFEKFISHAEKYQSTGPRP